MNLKGRTDVNQSGLDTFQDRDQIYRIGDGPSKSAGGGVGGESRGFENKKAPTMVRTAEDTTDTASVMTKRNSSNHHQQSKGVHVTNVLSNTTNSSSGSNGSGGFRQKFGDASTYVVRVTGKYSRFIGPGFMISVSYMDPGNYSTDVCPFLKFLFDG